VLYIVHVQGDLTRSQTSQIFTCYGARTLCSVDCNKKSVGLQQQETTAVVELWACDPIQEVRSEKNAKFHQIIKFHKVTELFPNRKVRIVRQNNYDKLQIKRNHTHTALISVVHQ